MKRKFIAFCISLLMCFSAFTTLTPINNPDVSAAPTTATSSWSESSLLYYSQLNTDQKGIYDAFLNATTEPCETSFTYNFTETVSFFSETKEISKEQTAVFSDHIKKTLDFSLLAFTNDHPEIFWLERNIDFKYTYTFTETDNGYIVSLRSVEIPVKIRSSCSTPENSEILRTQLENVLSGIYVDTSQGRYNQVKYIHDIICSMTDYNKDGTHANSCLGVFLSPYLSACEGYATAFKILCDRYSIPCVIISGTDKSNNGHMWCAVRMEDDRWYGVDITWDDQNENSAYLLKGSEVFDATHDTSSNPSGAVFAIPALSDTDYNPEIVWTQIASFNNFPEQVFSFGADETLENIYKVLGASFGINGTDTTVDVTWSCSYYTPGQTGRFIFTASPATQGYYVSETCNDTVAVQLIPDVSAKPLNFETATSDSSGTGWQWSNDTKTLTLTDYKTVVYNSDAITLPDGATLELNGTSNEISCTGNGFAGIRAKGALKITGSSMQSSSISIKGASSYGIVSDGALVTQNAGTDISEKDCAVMSYDTCNFTDAKASVSSCSKGIVSTKLLSIDRSFLNLSASLNLVNSAGNINISDSNVILTSSENPYISDTSTVSDSLIITNNTAKIYGNKAKLLNNLSLRQKNFTIESGQTFIIPTGITLTVQDSSSVINSGTLTCVGSLANNGSLTNYSKFIVGGKYSSSGIFTFVPSCVDTDGNGILNLIDIIKMADMLSAFSEKPQDISTVDINSDGRFSLLDMLTLAYYIVGLAE